MGLWSSWGNLIHWRYSLFIRNSFICKCDCTHKFFLVLKLFSIPINTTTRHIIIKLKNKKYEKYEDYVHINSEFTVHYIILKQSNFTAHLWEMLFSPFGWHICSQREKLVYIFKKKRKKINNFWLACRSWLSTIQETDKKEHA